MNLNTEIAAQAAMMALKQATGAQPSLKTMNGKAVIFWQGSELSKMQAWLGGQMKAPASTSPSAVNLDFDWSPVVYPLIFPVALTGLGALAVAFAIGKATK